MKNKRKAKFQQSRWPIIMLVILLSGSCISSDKDDRIRPFTENSYYWQYHLKGQSHYDQILTIRQTVRDHPVPINNIKVYGGSLGWTGGINEGTQRFWRNIFGGSAATRFHREGPSPHQFGIGLNVLAQMQIRSMRMFADAMTIFTCVPHNDLLVEREDNEAYCLAELGKQYAVYFPNGGEVSLDVSDIQKSLSIRWLDIKNNEWQEETSFTNGKTIKLKTPGEGNWAVLLLSK